MKWTLHYALQEILICLEREGSETRSPTTLVFPEQTSTLRGNSVNEYPHSYQYTSSNIEVIVYKLIRKTNKIIVENGKALSETQYILETNVECDYLFCLIYMWFICIAYI